MPKVSLLRAVPLTAAQAFSIAADVAAYQDFLPLVSRSIIYGVAQEQGPIKRFTAELMVAVKRLGLNESFTSQVAMNAAEHTVIATSQDGPLRNLRAMWSIRAIDGARSTAAIDIDYEFKSKLLQLAADQLMSYAMTRMLEAFEARGRQLYPASALPNI